jgi:hypothetical protein
MDKVERATFDFDAEVHRALRQGAAAGNRSISDMVKEAVLMALAEGAVIGATLIRDKMSQALTWGLCCKPLKWRPTMAS